MNNDEFSKQAKIASPERYGEVIELKKTATNQEKDMYYQGVADYWIEKEETEKRIEEIKETNKLMENYKKENVLQIADILLEVSANSGEILGQIVERKIVKVEGNKVLVAIKTKDEEEIIRIYSMNLDFNKIKNISYSKDAILASPIRAGSIVEVKGIAENKKRQEYYDRIPDFWDKKIEQDKEEK